MAEELRKAILVFTVRNQEEHLERSPEKEKKIEALQEKYSKAFSNFKPIQEHLERRYTFLPRYVNPYATALADKAKIATLTSELETQQQLSFRNGVSKAWRALKTIRSGLGSRLAELRKELNEIEPNPEKYEDEMHEYQKKTNEDYRIEIVKPLAFVTLNKVTKMDGLLHLIQITSET